MRIVRSVVPALAAGLLLCSVSPAQQVREAGTQKSDAQLAATAEKAWAAQDWAAAAAAYTKLVDVRPDDGLAWHHLGYALHALGRLDEALVAHVKAADLPGVAGVGAYNAACVHALQGRTDDAFAWLEKARAKGFADRAQAENDSDFASIKGDPRFAKFVESLGKAAPVAQAFVQTTARQGARLSFWNQSGSVGQIAVDYGQPRWKAEYAKAVDSDEFVGKRWRLGNDFWTTLDTNVALRVGDAEIPAGAWYLTVEKRSDGAFVLAFNDPAVIRKQKLDAYLAHLSKGGIEVEVMHETSDEVAEQLEIGLQSKKGDIAHGALTIRFGPHVLKAPFEIAF